MSPHRALPLAVLIATLSACSGGGGGGGDNGSIGPINCAGLTGATAEATVTCAGGCGGDYSEAAVDGDLDTYAILELGAASGTLNIRATAADGVTYPAGTPAAVVFGIARDGNSASPAITISTYLDGTLQQTGNVAGPSVVDGFDRPSGRSAIGTNLPFDAIELSYTQSGGTGPIELRVHEFCTSVN